MHFRKTVGGVAHTRYVPEMFLMLKQDQVCKAKEMVKAGLLRLMHIYELEKILQSLSLIHEKL